jgi:hypothetical protein
MLWSASLLSTANHLLRGFPEDTVARGEAEPETGVMELGRKAAVAEGGSSHMDLEELVHILTTRSSSA